VVVAWPAVMAAGGKWLGLNGGVVKHFGGGGEGWKLTGGSSPWGCGWTGRERRPEGGHEVAMVTTIDGDVPGAGVELADDMAVPDSVRGPRSTGRGARWRKRPGRRYCSPRGVLLG
jgi:hypothetical protein